MEPFFNSLTPEAMTPREKQIALAVGVFGWEARRAEQIGVVTGRWTLIPPGCHDRIYHYWWYDTDEAAYCSGSTIHPMPAAYRFPDPANNGSDLLRVLQAFNRYTLLGIQGTETVCQFTTNQRSCAREVRGSDLAEVVIDAAIYALALERGPESVFTMEVPDES